MHTNEHTIIELDYPDEDPDAPGTITTRSCKILLSRTGQELLARMYARKGYGLQATMAHAGVLHSLVVQVDGRTVGTLSIRMDDGRLAAEEQYPEYIAALRQRSARICEFGQLAVDPSVRSKHVLGALFHIAWVMAIRLLRATDVVIEVSPRHTLFYRRMLRFEQLGPQRMCERVGVPGVLLHMEGKKGCDLIAQFGGRPQLAAQERSFYPYFFHPDAEESLLQRITGYASPLGPRPMSRATA